jgi:hypothetical protein
VEFKDIKGKLVYRITDAGKEAAKPESPWRRPAAAPGRKPKERPVLVPKPSSGRKGFVVHFVRHPLAKGRAFPTVKDAVDFARRIQAGYAKKGEPVPDITLDYHRYGAISQKVLVKMLNGEIDDGDVIERWEGCVPAYSNMKTYERYEAITE